MEQSPWRKKLISLLTDPRLGLSPALDLDAAAPRLETYIGLWQKWNRIHNLTAEKEVLPFLEKHVFESLLFARALAPDAKILDFGSGAGLPGIPLKIAMPGLDVTLLESQRRRANFLRTVVRELGLPGLEAVEGRGEEQGRLPTWRGAYDAVVFRAVADTSRCLDLGAPFLRPGGRVLLMRTAAQARQAAGIRHALKFADAAPVSGYGGAPCTLLSFVRETPLD
ncbi:MAG: 16S rRNA (guanine(527)-N(7))-methyltransferase RsmG [Nitrospinaceae bacterium]